VLNRLIADLQFLQGHPPPSLAKQALEAKPCQRPGSRRGSRAEHRRLFQRAQRVPEVGKYHAKHLTDL
jgi:hypothetical protein